MSAQLFIDGAAGTTGLEIANRLASRSEFSLIVLGDEDRKDPARRREALNSADFAILCLPDSAAHEAAALIDNPTTRVIDASSAHRTSHSWTYGFPELCAAQYRKIRTARRLSNPGCYPTAFLALVAPLVAAGLIDPASQLSLQAVSGYSGGGKALIARFETHSLGFRSYALGLDHKHLDEMQIHAGIDYPPIFAPAVIPIYRGMIAEVPLHFDKPMAERLRDALERHYEDCALVSVASAPENGEILLYNKPARRNEDSSEALGTNADTALAENRPESDAPLELGDRLELFIASDASGRSVRLIARLDNLGKGASGACIQNLNLMAGLDELAGLAGVNGRC